MSTATLTAEPWRLVSGIDPAKPIRVGETTLRELPPEACWAHCTPPTQEDRIAYGEEWYKKVLACWESHPGACYRYIESPSPGAIARRTAWNSKERTNLEFLRHEIRKKRSEARLGLKEYLLEPDGVVDHGMPGVPGFSLKACHAQNVNNKLEWLADLRHREIHMAALVQSCG